MRYFMRPVTVITAALLACLTAGVLADEIHTAVQSRDVNAVKAILKSKAGAVNAVTADGNTPLHLAADTDSAELVNVLVEAGAKINELNKEGHTALHRAALLGCNNSAEALIDRGIDWTLKTRNGATALQLAIQKEKTGIVKTIITKTVAAYTDPAFTPVVADADQAAAERMSSLFIKLRAIDPCPRVNFASGMACLLVKDYSRAKVAFEAVLMAEPENERAKLELARAYHAAGQYEEARGVFRDVLRRTTDSRVRSSIQAYMESMDANEKKWFVGGSIMAGVFQDDNVNVGPNSEVVTIYPIEFGSVGLIQLDVTGDSQPLDSVGYSIAASLGVTRDWGSQGGWMGSVDSALYNSWLTDEPDFESRFYQISAGIKFVSESRILGLPVRGGHIDLGGEPLMNMYGIAPAYSIMFGQGGIPVTATTTLTLETRDYDSLNDRDGFFVSAGQTLRGDFNEGGTAMTIGITVAHDGTDAAVYEYDGMSWNFQMDFRLAPGASLYGKLTRFRSSYAEREALAPEDRKDTQNLLTVGLSKKIGTSVMLDANVIATRNESTFALYTYDRNVATISCTYCF